MAAGHRTPVDLTRRSYRPVTLCDGTPAEVALEGEWAYVRMPSGREGRVRTSSLEQYVATDGRRPATREEVATELRRGFRVTLWQAMAFLGLLMAVLGALILLRLFNGG